MLLFQKKLRWVGVNAKLTLGWHVAWLHELMSSILDDLYEGQSQDFFPWKAPPMLTSFSEWGKVIGRKERIERECVFTGFGEYVISKSNHKWWKAPKKGSVGVFIVLGLTRKDKMVISSLRVKLPLYPSSIFFLPHSRLWPCVGLACSMRCLFIKQITKSPNHVARHILKECLPRCLGEMWIYSIRPSNEL